jgi:hypothetical protein
VRPFTGHMDVDPHCALTSSLDDGVRRLEQHREVGRQPVRVLAGQPQEPVPLGLDLFTVVEHVGDIAGGRCHRRGKAQHDGDPALHVGGAEAVQDAALPPGRQVVSGRDGVEVPGENDSLASPPRRARHDRVASAVDREVPKGAECHLDRVGDLLLVTALGVDVHKSRSQRGCVLADVESRHLGTVTM